MKLGWLALGLLVALPAHATTRFAVLAGNDVGHESDRPLRWAEADAKRMREVMLELGGVHPDRAQLVLGGGAAELQVAIAQLKGQVAEAKRRGERTEVLVYYSGHGDKETLHLGKDAVPLSRLEAWLGGVPADAVLTVLDACRTSAVRSGASRGAQRAPAFDIRIARQGGPTGRVLIQSAGDDEVAQESDDLEGGFFTHQLLTGLRGAADADKDRQVTVAEVYRYAYHRTLSTSFGSLSAVQHPSMEMQLEGEGELALTALERSGASLVLASDVKGELLIVDDASSRVVAELKLAGGERIELALPAGAYRLIRRDDGKVFAGKATLAFSKAQVVSAASMTEQPRVAALQRGARWDPTPWRVAAGAVVGRPRALGSGVAAGGQVSLEHRLESPLFWTVRFSGTGAGASSSTWQMLHQELVLGGGMGLFVGLGPVRLQAALLVDGVAVRGVSRRAEAERLESVGLGAGVEQSAWTMGPGVSAEGAVTLTMVAGLDVRLGGGVSLAWVRVDGATANAVAPYGQIGIGYSF